VPANSGEGNVGGFPVGTRIEIEAYVVRHNGAQTTVWLPGVGKSGTWSIPSSTLASGTVLDLPGSVLNAILAEQTETNAEERHAQS